MINNKKSKILMGCLALLLVLSIGYALFSQSITINGTTTAKGDFDITYTCELITSELSMDESLIIPASTGTGKCSIDGQNITTVSNFSKPTDNVYYKITLTNSGSIPAVLKTIDSSNNFSEDFTNVGDEMYIDKTNYLAGNYLIYKNGDNGNAGSEVHGDSSVENEKITLQPNDNITLIIMASWFDSSLFGETQPKVPEEGATMNYNIKLGFEQTQ